MFDIFDIFSPNGTEGTRWTRIITGVIGAICGGGLGVLYGYEFGTTDLSMVGNGLIGGLVGAALGALFSGLVLVIFITLVCIAAIIGWQVMTGRA